MVTVLLDINMSDLDKFESEQERSRILALHVGHTIKTIFSAKDLLLEEKLDSYDDVISGNILSIDDKNFDVTLGYGEAGKIFLTVT